MLVFYSYDTKLNICTDLEVMVYIPSPSIPAILLEFCHVIGARNESTKLQIQWYTVVSGASGFIHLRWPIQCTGAYLNDCPNFCPPSKHRKLSCILYVELQEIRNRPKWLPSPAWPLCRSPYRASPDYHHTLCHSTLYVLH